MRRFQTTCYLIVLALFTVAMFLVFCIAWLLTVPFDPCKRRVIHFLSRCWSKGMYIIHPWWRVRVEGLENIPRGGGPYVVVSNHQAMLDIPLLYALPLNFKWVSKREVYKIPIFGWVLWMHGDVAIERGGASSVKKMFADCNSYLKRGVSVIIFPEGTRTRTGRMGPFKEGALLLARQSNTPLLPVVIDGTYDAFTKGMVGPHTFRVRILPPVASADISAEELHRQMIDQHRAIAPQRYS